MIAIPAAELKFPLPLPALPHVPRKVPVTGVGVGVKVGVTLFVAETVGVLVPEAEVEGVMFCPQPRGHKAATPISKITVSIFFKPRSPI